MSTPADDNSGCQTDPQTLLTPQVDPSAPTMDAPRPGGPTRTIGRYQIKSMIGSGGMGAVYLAVQEQPKRTVAVKVILAGSASPAALRRFEYESQVLARMRHPGIAQIYEAGTYDGGSGPVPYFAMEYIPDAKTLREFAERRRYTSKQRLELFIKVCDAVQYGHTKGIIHRDLKPANILVDSAGWPKIIDYGVARGLDSDMVEATLQTKPGQLVGTPQYISPEQCSGDPHGIDVRSDIYSLGVVLYELLTGRFPYEVGTAGVYEIARHICEDPPTPIGALDRTLRGDIETIVSKALEKDRERRYQSVADFMADIRRHLSDQPILARPIGPVGHMRKWVKRNRQLTTVGATAALLLVTVSSVLIARVIIAEREASANLVLAEQNLRRASQNFEFARGLLDFKDAREGVVNVERLLDDAAANLDANTPDLAATEADFREILGVSYTDLRRLAKAREQLQRVVDLRLSALPKGAADPALADAMHSLAAAMYWDRDYEDASRLYQESLEMRQRLFGERHPAIAFSLTHLAACALELGRLDEAQSLYEAALRMRQRLYGNVHPEVAASHNNIARLWMVRRDYTQAERSFRHALEMITSLSDGVDINVSHASHNLAQCLLAMSRHAEARDLFAAALDIRRELLRADHPQVAASRSGLARACLALGELDRAHEEASAALAICRTEFRPDHPALAAALRLMGDVMLALDQPAKAEQYRREAESLR